MSAVPVKPKPSRRLKDGLYKTNLDNGIVLYRLSKVDKDVLRTWADDVVRTLYSYGTHQPYLAVYDLSQLSVSPTSYLGRLIQTLDKVYPIVRGRTAVIFARTPMSMAFRILVRMMHSPHRPKRIFFSEEEAIDWLKRFKA